jgi:hypothetical protein
MTTIRVALGITKNIGNYESLRLDCEYETDISDNAIVDDEYINAWAMVDAQIEKKLLELEADTDGK